VIVGVQAIPACFDVEQHRVSCPPEAVQVYLQSYDTLLRHPVRTDSDGYRAANVDELEPGLALGWDVSSDHRTYSLQLRRSVASPCGHELTAHDVKWAWERAFALNSWSARAARRCGVGTPDAVRVVQPYTIQFRLEEPHALFPGMLAAPLPPIYDLQTVREHCPVGDPWGDAWLRSHTAGFGPYSLEEGVDAEEAGLAANMGYWEGAAREKRVLLRAIAAGSARSEALWRGSIDVADGLPAAELEALAAKPGVRVAQVPGCRQTLLRVDPEFAPFDQPHVRQATALALPYDDITREVYGGRARPLLVEQDARAARALLRESGYASGFRMTLYVPQDSPDLEATAQLIQRAGMRLGLKIVVEIMNRALFAREKASRHLPVYLEERRPMVPLLKPAELEPLTQVDEIVLAQPHDQFPARDNVAGFVRRADGHPRYFELRKS
jgi:peptide/nickel transport system substrate-binding protein